MFEKYKYYLLNKVVDRSIIVLGANINDLILGLHFRTICGCVEYAFSTLTWYEKLFLTNAFTILNIVSFKIDQCYSAEVFLREYILENFGVSSYLSDLQFNIPNVKPEYHRNSNYEFFQFIRLEILKEISEDIKSYPDIKRRKFNLSQFFI